MSSTIKAEKLAGIMPTGVGTGWRLSSGGEWNRQCFILTESASQVKALGPLETSWTLPPFVLGKTNPQQDCEIERCSFIVHLLFTEPSTPTRKNMLRPHSRNMSRIQFQTQFWAWLSHLSVVRSGKISSPPWENPLLCMMHPMTYNSRVCFEDYIG